MRTTILTLLLFCTFSTTVAGAPRYAQGPYTGDLIILGHRELNPRLSRFIEPDPEQEFQSGYTYGAGMPVTYADPNGDWIFERIRAFIDRYLETTEQHSLDWEATRPMVGDTPQVSTSRSRVILTARPQPNGAVAMLPPLVTVDEELQTLRNLTQQDTTALIDVADMTPRDKEMERLHRLQRLEHYNTRESMVLKRSHLQYKTAMNRSESLTLQRLQSEQFPDDTTQEQIDRAYIGWRKPKNRRKYASYLSGWAINSTAAKVPMFFEPASTRFQMPANDARILRRWLPTREDVVDILNPGR